MADTLEYQGLEDELVTVRADIDALEAGLAQLEAFAKVLNRESVGLSWAALGLTKKEQAYGPTIPEGIKERIEQLQDRAVDIEARLDIIDGEDEQEDWYAELNADYSREIGLSLRAAGLI